MSGIERAFWANLCRLPLPMHSLKLCTVGRPVSVDARAAGAWQAGVIPFHSFWVFEAVVKPRPYRARVQCHAPRLGTLSNAAHSSSRHSGVAALTGRNCHETMYRCGFHIPPIKPMKMRSLPTEQSHCVHSFKLCIGSVSRLLSEAAFGLAESLYL